MRALFLDLVHGCSVPEVRKHLASKRLPFKVPLIWENGHPEHYRFPTNGVSVVYLFPNTASVIQPLEQGVIRTFKAHYTWYSGKD